MNKVTYNTKQKELVINVIKDYKKDFTIKDIYNLVKGDVGLTTIYRLVDGLVFNGRLKKYINDNNITYYRYLEKCDKKNHFYLKCSKCGKLIHTHCKCINDLNSHIMKKHKFLIDNDNIIINGICNDCK